jgi:phosphate acetyltransferase
VYVGSPEDDTGKPRIAVGILHRLAATVARGGVFRPITRAWLARDYILELLLDHTTAGLRYDVLVAGMTTEHVLETAQRRRRDGDTR